MFSNSKFFTDRSFPGLLFRIALFVFFFQCSMANNELSPEAESLKDHVEYLASEELEGRKSGSKGNQLAAEYIANHFKKHNVQPVDGSYFQEFTVVTDVKLAGNNSAVIKTANEEIEWKAGEDYTPLGSSENGEFSGSLVFVGYGISADEHDFNEYENLDVEGKIVVVLRSAPDYQTNPHGKFSEFASLLYKRINAREHGAAGIIYVSPTDMDDDLISLSLQRGGRHSGIVALHARRDAVDKILPKDRSLKALEQQIKSTGKPHSFEILNSSISLSVSLEFIEAPTANAIGMVMGTDDVLKNEYIIVGAHFDHLGWGGEGSRYSGSDPKIHYGADDNASGTAAMMEMAAQIARSPLPRSVIFMGFSGEEMGLLGSQYYCTNPLVPLENTIMMLNMDMVGKIKDNALNVTGTGTAVEWDGLIDSLGNTYELAISKSASGYGASDHSSFYQKDIPVINFFTGLHEDYHRPGDTWEKLNYEGIKTVVEFGTDIIKAVGNFVQKPQFVRAQQSENEGRKMSFNVTVGTIPDYSDHPKGMKITGVKEGSPAEKGGLQGGDVMIKFGGIEIKNIYDYTYCLGKYKPGDEVDIVVLRGESETEEVTLKVKLEGRSAGAN